MSTIANWLSNKLALEFKKPGVRSALDDGPAIVVTHASDLEGYCQAIALSHLHPDDDSTSTGALIKHVVGDFAQDRVTDPATPWPMVPEKSLSNADKVKAFDAQWEEMKECPTKVVAFDKLAWCYRHLDYCRVFGTIESKPKPSAQSWQEAMVAADSDECVQVPQATLEDVTCTEECSSWREYKQHVGGTTCVDFSTYGKMQMSGGDSTYAFNVFCCEILVNRPITWMSEIAGACTVTYYGSRLGPYYNLFSAWLNPMESGAAESRPRLYCWGTCKLRTAFHGTEGEFHFLFDRRRQIHATDYWMVSDKERRQYELHRAKVKGHFHSPDVDKVPFEHQVTALEFDRYQTHDEKHCKTGDRKKVVDIEHNSTWSGGGDVWPCLVTHAAMLRLDKQQFAHPLEYLLAQGEPFLLDQSKLGPYKCCIGPAVRALVQARDNGYNKVIKLAGNGMAMISAGQFYLYCTAMTEVTSLIILLILILVFVLMCFRSWMRCSMSTSHWSTCWGLMLWGLTTISMLRLNHLEHRTFLGSCPPVKPGS